MDRPAEYQADLDAALARTASLFRSPRSCVVVLSNRTSLAWELTSVIVRRGGLATQPPARILPWRSAVFGAQSLAAHDGAGCGGIVRYASRAGHVALELRYDVPYAGATAACLEVSGPRGHAISTSVRNRDGDGGPNVFFLQMMSQIGPSHQPAAHGVLAS